MTVPILTMKLQNYLMKYFAGRVRKLREQGVTVTLTWREFLGLVSKRQIKTLEDAIAANRLRYLQNKDNPFALLLTWNGYQYHSADHPVFSVESAKFCCRRRSEAINRPAKGQKLGNRHKANIAAGLTGLAKSDAHRNAISTAKKGVAIAKWTPERKAERSKQRRERIALRGE